ncbi:MAG: cytochrome c maturation protein CcmE [Halobacteriota archaeon]|nr:cytochrome c maturation protein CcmE [Halobacteriota archaeon]
MARKNTQVIVGVVIIAISLIAAIYSLQDSVTPYSTVSDIVGKGDNMIGKRFHVNGTVVNDTIDWSQEDMLLKFKLTDNVSMMDVEYSRPAPNNFEDGRMVVVEGMYNEDRVFEAREILVKCPSKYAPDESYDTEE